MSDGLDAILAWLSSQGRTPFDFQRKAWDAYLRGQDVMIQAPTGMGKTMAAFGGPLIQFLNDPPPRDRRVHAPLTVLWITPLRALASDTVNALREAAGALKLPWSIELRTSDTSASVRKRQKERLPTVLVTTPESLSLLLSYEDAPQRLATPRCVIVDEWHELLGTKRGIQTELGLARLRRLSPALVTCGLSATLADTPLAMRVLMGSLPRAASAALITAPDDKAILLHSVIPPALNHFPWAGHLGLHLLDQVIAQIESAGSTLLFTNTRSQSELWFRALSEAKPDWLGSIGVHHGSIDRKLRARIEQMLREGKMRVVVCTSSLDLGVDFWPVDQVIQMGSPKSIGRTMQRAGRSGHRPGAQSRIWCVPTHAFELIEFSAARLGIERRSVEARLAMDRPLDVLAQHVVTIAAGGGFVADELLAEVRDTHAFAALTGDQWQWVMDFCIRGGPSLIAYPRFARITQRDGLWRAATPAIARMHRMGIGTITSDGSIQIATMNGRKYGTVEESFIAKLKPGDAFLFSGKALELVRVHQMQALVRPAKKRSVTVPRWYGGRLPLSGELAAAVRYRLEQARDGYFVDSEMNAVADILKLQQRVSAIPARDQILIESLKTREGHHHFLFPFQGRLVHEGVGSLVAFRLTRDAPRAITVTVTDYGIELLTPSALPIEENDWHALLSPDRLVEDLIACVNVSELARRQFREIARIAGLLVPTHPGARQSVRMLQASSELFFDVFREFDPENLLLEQSRREVLERQLEFVRMKAALEQMVDEAFVFTRPARLTPLAFPLWAERIASQQIRTETPTQRIERIAEQLEKAAQRE